MRRMHFAAVLTVTCCLLPAASASADVIIGGVVVAPAPVDVRVGHGVVVVVPARTSLVAPAPVPVQNTTGPVIVSRYVPAVRPDAEPNLLPAPRVLTTGATPAAKAAAVPPPPQPKTVPMAPRDFAKSFKASPEAASYEVLFMHPISNKPFTVTFKLPAGNPRVSYAANALVFDYGRQQVEIRFQAGNQVSIAQMVRR